MTTPLTLPKIAPVPDLNTNKRNRIVLDILCRDNPKMQAEIKQRCANDFLFWAEHFCFAHDEFRPIEKRVFVLAMFEFQKEMALTMVDEIWKVVRGDQHTWNAGADKARRMTATYTTLLVIQWFGQFHGISSIITSKTEEDVDIQSNMNSPFERLRWQIGLQPQWLLPPRFNIKDKKNVKSKLVNFTNGGTISGCAPTDKAMRQARAVIWFGDEFAFVKEDYEVWAAASGTVRVRIVMSTPNGPFCKFYSLVFKKPVGNDGQAEEFHLFELDWWRHPENAQGLYIKSDNTFSSPFFDSIVRSNSRQTVAREWLRDHDESVGGIVFSMFRAESLVPGLRPDTQIPFIYRVWDLGLTAAVVFAQKDSLGRLRILREIVVEHEKLPKGTTVLKALAERAITVAERDFPGYTILDIGDPYSSKFQLAMQEKTEYDILEQNHKIRVKSAFIYDTPAPERKLKRIEILSDKMSKDVELDNGKTTPGLLIDPLQCRVTLEAFKTGYRRRVEDNGTVTDEIIKKHPFIDVVDCVGMAAVKAYEEQKQEQTRTRRQAAQKRTKDWRPTNQRNWRPSRG